ncbi:MAG: YhcH/YjgK/YiaL family protein [Segetibacter sp.]
MKKSFFLSLITTIYLGSLLIGCHSSAHLSKDGVNEGDVARWYNDHQWLNGLQLTPHGSINKQEFSRQYLKNKKWWDEAFQYIKTQDLANLKPGSYVIDSGNVIATISELSPKEKEQVNWEAHRNFNDLQYIIRGKAKMGVTPISDPEAKVTVPYNDKADTETFSDAGGKFYDAEPGTFFIFTPKDIHRPAFKVAGYDIIKKIVIKVRVP